MASNTHITRLRPDDGTEQRMRIHIAALNGDLDEIKRQIEENVAKPSERDMDPGHNPYSVCYPSHYAACGGHVHVLEYLVNSCGVKLDEEREKPSGTTPLHVAVLQGRASCVKWMLDQHIDINLTDYKGVTPLMVAAGYGRSAIAKLLLDYGGQACAVDAKDKNKDTALMFAVQGRHWDIATRLLEQGADPRHVAATLRGSYQLNPPPRALLELVQKSLAEAARFRILYKARALGDAAYAIQHKAMSLTAPDVPIWYKNRVLADLPLPQLDVKTPQDGDAGKNGVFQDTVGFVLGLDSTPLALAHPLVQELMGYLAPTWVPERKPLGPL